VGEPRRSGIKIIGDGHIYTAKELARAIIDKGVGPRVGDPPRAYLTAAAEESHPLNSGASLAAILNHIAAFRVGHAFLNLHCLFANKAAQQIDQRAFIVIQMRFFRHPSHFSPSFPFAFRPCGQAV
jgi:hypothetical protein